MAERAGAQAFLQTRRSNAEIFTKANLFPSSYSFGAFREGWKSVGLLLSTLMLPNSILIIPRYAIFRNLNTLDSYFPFYLLSFFTCYPFFTYMLVQFMRGLPRELDEAAYIDGCGTFMTLTHVLLPLLKPALFSAGLLQFLWTYNDFFSSLIYINTIGAAARIARPGDTVVVHEGEYREWVKPREGGLSDSRRITYQAAEGERAVIKGSERIQSWEPVSGAVWKATLSNSLFGGWNPYREAVVGDWLLHPMGRRVHLGDIYLNGMSFYEAETRDAVFSPARRSEVLDHWTGEMTPIQNSEQTQYLWFAEVDSEHTVLYANFHGADPNHELVEANVRK